MATDDRPIGRPPFEHVTRVRFHQADPAGVLFFGRYFELFEETYEEWLRASDLDAEAILRQEGFSTPIVHAEADYRRPVRVGEAVKVTARIERLGQTSLTMAYAVVGSEGDVRATGRVVHVFVDVTTWDTIQVPEEARAALERMLD